MEEAQKPLRWYPVLAEYTSMWACMNESKPSRLRHPLDQEPKCALALIFPPIDVWYVFQLNHPAIRRVII